MIPIHERNREQARYGQRKLYVLCIMLLVIGAASFFIIRFVENWGISRLSIIAPQSHEHAEYEQRRSVVKELTDEGFRALIKQQRPSVVVFYHSSCKECNEFFDDFEYLAESIRDEIRKILTTERESHKNDSYHSTSQRWQEDAYRMNHKMITFGLLSCEKYPEVCDADTGLDVTFYPSIVASHIRPGPLLTCNALC